jgi:hypothetical protein
MSIERELSLIEARTRNLTKAIAQGEPPDTLLTHLRDEEARKKSLVYELDGLARRDQVASLDHTRLKRQLVAKATDLRGLLTRRVPQARQVIRKLVVGRLAFTPFEEEGRKGYRFVGEGTYGRLLTGDTLSTSDGGSISESATQARSPVVSWILSGWSSAGDGLSERPDQCGHEILTDVPAIAAFRRSHIFAVWAA